MTPAPKPDGGRLFPGEAVCRVVAMADPDAPYAGNVVAHDPETDVVTVRSPFTSSTWTVARDQVRLIRPVDRP